MRAITYWNAMHGADEKVIQLERTIAIADSLQWEILGKQFHRDLARRRRQYLLFVGSLAAYLARDQEECSK